MISPVNSGNPFGKLQPGNTPLEPPGPLVEQGPERVSAGTIAEAAREMTRRQIGCLVVVEPGGGVAGILTERDIIINVIARGLAPESTTVAAAMTKTVVTCNAQTSIRQARRTMARLEKR